MDKKQKQNRVNVMHGKRMGGWMSAHIKEEARSHKRLMNQVYE